MKKPIRLRLLLAAVISAVALGEISTAQRINTAQQVSTAPKRDARIELGIPGRTNAYPSVAADGRFVAIAWGATKDGTTDVYVVISRDGGSVFGSPVRTSNADSAAKLSGEQPPRVTLVPRSGKDPSIVVVWTTATTEGTRLVSTRSEDGGRTFGSQKVVPGTLASGNRGWEAIATDREGSVVAVWLDHRELAKSDGGHASHGTHAHPTTGQRGDGAERAQLSKLFFARMDDPQSVRSVTGSVCYCCKTALTTGPDGSIYAAWRHVYPGNRRDIAFAVSRDRGRTFGSPVRVSEDQWQLDGCPENGPAIAIDASSRVHVLWPTLITESGQETLALYHAVSRDGRTFSRRARVPTTGAAYHPQVTAMPRGELLVAWEEFATGGRIVRLARGLQAAAGSMTFTPVPLPSPSRGTYPAVVATASGAVAVWVTPESRLTGFSW